MNLKNKKFLLGITGSIAAYKAIDLIRKLKKLDADIKVVLSAGASAFVTPLTVQTISGNPVFENLLDVESEASMSHIALARWADVILIAPATAHFIAKLTHGLADDLLTTACLATTNPIMLAPAMNVAMWSNAATQDNVNQLINRKVQIIHPDAGIQACGETGEGRMVEPEMIVAEVVKFFSQSKRLSGKKILITAGPTQEAIDPVRYITNRSSGKMGYALAKAASMEGAEVTLISGPVSLSTLPTIKRIDVVSAKQMWDAVMSEVHKNDIFISTAAVSDYQSVDISSQKIKKANQTIQLTLERTPDILSAVALLKKRPIVIGFSAETNRIIENAKNKLIEKKLDMIVANEVGENKGFDSDYNEVCVIKANHPDVIKLPYASKEKIAGILLQLIDMKPISN